MTWDVGDEVVVDMPNLCVDGRVGVVVRHEESEKWGLLYHVALYDLEGDARRLEFLCLSESEVGE